MVRVRPTHSPQRGSLCAGCSSAYRQPHDRREQVNFSLWQYGCLYCSGNVYKQFLVFIDDLKTCSIPSAQTQAQDLKKSPRQWQKGIHTIPGSQANITDNIKILDYVQEVKIPLLTEPHQNLVPFPYRFTENENCAINTEILKFTNKGIIEPVLHVAGEFISNVFIRPKSDGQVRLILDLTLFNKFVEYKYFRRFSLETARDLVTPNSKLASIDLKGAYYTVPIYKPQRKFLRFVWSNELYEFTCMPNGLACCPQFFPIWHIRDL